MSTLRKGFDSLFSPPPAPEVSSAEDVIRQAWESVGRSLHESMGAYEQEQEQEKAEDGKTPPNVSQEQDNTSKE